MRKKTSPLKAIRAKCLDCSGYQPKEIRFCPVTECPLHFFRYGTNPHRAGVGPKQVLIPQKTLIESGKITKKEELNEPT